MFWKDVTRFVRQISVWEQLFSHIWTILAVSEKVMLIIVRTLVRDACNWCQIIKLKEKKEIVTSPYTIYDFMLL
jgi:hypothetical protein